MLLATLCARQGYVVCGGTSLAEHSAATYLGTVTVTSPVTVRARSFQNGGRNNATAFDLQTRHATRFCYAATRLTKGVFCNSAIKAAERDHDTVVQTMLQTKKEYRHLVTQLHEGTRPGIGGFAKLRQFLVSPVLVSTSLHLHHHHHHHLLLF